MKDYYKTIKKASLYNLFLGGAVLFLETMFNFPKIPISFFWAFLFFLVLMCVYWLVAMEVVAALPSNSKERIFVINGPYSKSRHPMYAAIIFILNPAIAILLRSYFLLWSIIPLAYLWKIFIKEEEKSLEEKFGRAYIDYRRNVPMLLPKAGFRAIAGYSLFFCFLFSAIFLFLNASSYMGRFKYFLQAEFSYKPKTKIETAAVQNASSPSRISDVFAVTAENIFEKELDIAKLGVKAPIILAEDKDESRINKLLNIGVVAYPDFSLPENGGPTVLIGHSSAYLWVKTDYGTVFALLDKLETGDEITVYSGGRKFVYSVYRKETVAYSKDSYKKLENIPKNNLVLITCWPPGTTFKRFMVFAELVRII